MYMEDTKVHTLLARFNSIVKLADRLEKTPRCFGTDEPLGSSEIHLVEMTGDNEETLGITDLAKLIGVTKGAVSQNLKKLEKKGFIKKIEDPCNCSRSIVKLTTKGKTAYYAHKHWHETMDGGFDSYVKNLSPDKIAFVIEFMSKVEDFLKRALK
jgi:DNA-binding MarR family transcriptional regulator